MTATTAPAMTDPPPRRRLRGWARRHIFTTFVVSAVALALVLRLGWGWYFARRLAVALEDLRRRGEPMELADFAESPLPPSENAWTYYAEAVRVISTSGVNSPHQSTIRYSPYPPHGTEWETLAGASEKANAAAFPLARRARQLQRLQFPQTGSNPYRGEWNDARNLANMLADGAEYAHVRGDDAESVERLLDALHLAHSIRQDPGILSQLIGVGMSALALDTAQQIIPTLKVDRPATGGAASPAQARALIAVLLDETDARQWFVRTLYRERSVLLATLNRLAAETSAIRPAADATVVRRLGEFDALIQTAAQQNGGQARNMLRNLQRSEGIDSSSAVGFAGRVQPVYRYSRWFEGFVGSGPAGLTRALEQFHRESAERRMTAVMLAARLYRHDHGRWPDDAAALVPGYLDAIPSDPFREDGGPLGYVVLRGALPDGGDRPLLFSEAGEPSATPKDAIDIEPMSSWQMDRRRLPGTPRREIRQYRDVSLWQPKARRFDEARKLAAEAVDDDPDKPDAPGDDAKHDDRPDRPAEQ